jgi:hypothetical protein
MTLLKTVVVIAAVAILVGILARVVADWWDGVGRLRRMRRADRAIAHRAWPERHEHARAYWTPQTSDQGYRDATPVPHDASPG